MTREEAISEARRSTIDDCGWFHDDDINTSEQNSIALVNKIYDDFESRTCDSCKHSFIRRKGESALCNIYEELMPIGLTLCNQWEQKQ